MGRKRQTRKRTDRVQSKTSLNSGNISSDSEAEKVKKTIAYTDRNAPTQATVSTSFGSHCLSDQTTHAEGAESVSYDRSELTQENFHSEKIRHTHNDHGQYYTMHNKFSNCFVWVSPSTPDLEIHLLS